MNILVVFGSRSTEHDVSIISGITVIEALEKITKYQVTPLYITKNGEWELGGNLADIEAHRKRTAKGKKVSVQFLPNKKLNVKEDGLFGKKHSFDVVVPILHGMNGEDGTLQGVFELAGVPYTGPAVLGSALGMDKIAMKDILLSHSIPLVGYYSLYRHDWELRPDYTIDKILEHVQFPIFVKPANLGSSIGISRVDKKEDLANALDVAAYYDSRIICESGVKNLQEINCAVRGTPAKQEASLLEEPITFEDFLTFEEKYINSGGTMQGVKSKVKIPAQLPTQSMTKEIQECAKKVFTVLNCAGACRIDFLVDTENKKFYVNEINTIPGSLQYHLWEKSGVSFQQLLEGMIEDAIQREREKSKNSFAFQSEILNRKGGIKK